MTYMEKPLAFWDKDVPITAAPLDSGLINGIKPRPSFLTAFTSFSAIDAGQMVQSCIRTCEPFNYRAVSNLLPALL
jgi:hypothetical protein